MLLAVDVGNTNITLGVFKDGVLIGNFRLNTRIARTSDEYGIAIRNILYHVTDGEKAAKKVSIILTNSVKSDSIQVVV